MQFTIWFMDLNGIEHNVHTDSERTAIVTAEQMSIQFDKAEITEGFDKPVRYSHGGPING